MRIDHDNVKYLLINEYVINMILSTCATHMQRDYQIRDILKL
jgi:hypothetical protein